MSIIGYVDVEYANSYVAQHLLSTDALRISWENTSLSDKEVLLRQSYGQLELLPFKGRKYSSEQTSSFPRWPSQEIPEIVKAAQVENALILSDGSIAEEDKFYANLERHGVQSYSIGNLSESLGGATKAYALVSSKASLMLKPFISGGYGIRGLRK